MLSRITRFFTHALIIIVLIGVPLLYTKPAFAANATLSFSPASSAVTTGTSFDVQIILNTGGSNTSGTDVYVHFDKSKLSLTDITPGSIYNQYVGKAIDNAQGTAAISGLSTDVSSLFKGTGTFATFHFQPLAQGTATVTFDFTPGNQNDSNVADFDTQEDVLTSVTNGTYQISGAGSTSSNNSNTSGSTTTSSGNNAVGGPSGGQLPVTADLLPIIILSGSSLFLIGTGIFLFHFIRH